MRSPPRSSPPPDAPLTARQKAADIVPPHLAAALDALEVRQAQEWANLNRLEGIATLMDAQFAIPLIPIRIGLDTLIGFIPGIGDTISLGVASYIMYHAKQMGASSGQLIRMVFNSFIDWLIGLVPLIGDLIDIGWQSNLRNTRYLREIMEKKWAKERDAIFQGRF